MQITDMNSRRQRPLTDAEKAHKRTLLMQLDAVENELDLLFSGDISRDITRLIRVRDGLCFQILRLEWVSID